ncbi:MAG: 2-C-methyl-D-erythritol 4-phosphate cytidylyltransferase [Bacilli bacterium]|nr:2-C-methyl-D-erythritol 4-phosphate cytidylyltransferase [Bacilli bacterium]
MKNIAVILAAGVGNRFGGDTPKQFLKIDDKEILVYSIETFSQCSDIDEIVLVVNDAYLDTYKRLIKEYKIGKISQLVSGGKERQNSVENAIEFIASKEEECVVLVHDAARPFVSERIIKENIEAVLKHKCCTTAVKSSDSVYLTNNGEFVKEVNRNDVYLAQTPQSGLLSIFKEAYKGTNVIYTDEAALFSELGYIPYIVVGEEKNKKITFKEDIKK